MGRLRFFLERTKDVRFTRFWLFLFLAALLFTVLYWQVKPRQYELRLFDVAKETIRSPVTVEDKEATARLKEEAAAKVADVYTLKKEYAENRVDLLSSLFAAIESVQNEADSDSSPSELAAKLEERLPPEWLAYLSADEWQRLLSASPDELKTAKEAALTVVHAAMRERISQADLEQARAKAAKELEYAALSPPIREAVAKLCRQAVIPNVVYDRTATEEKRARRWTK